MQLSYRGGLRRAPSQMRILSITQLGTEILSFLEWRRTRERLEQRESFGWGVPPSELVGSPSSGRSEQLQQRDSHQGVAVPCRGSGGSDGRPGEPLED